VAVTKHETQTGRYTTLSRVFHWGMAILILATIPVGLLMVQQGIGRSLQNALFLFHKNVGVLLLVLAVARLIWRWRNPAPKLPSTLPAWQVKAAHTTHMALYGLLFLVPLAGYVRVRAGGFPIESLDALGLPTLVPRSDALAAIAKSVHYYSGAAMGIIIAVHIAAALYHRIQRKDGVFARMWPIFGAHRPR
jgi:cytochrome b561